jgi:hypothetical protein
MIRHLKNDTKHEIKKCNMSAKLQMKASVVYTNIWFLVCRCKETECWQAACMQNLFISPLQCGSTPTNPGNKWDCLKIIMNIWYKSNMHSKLQESGYVLLHYGKITKEHNVYKQLECKIFFISLLQCVHTKKTSDY